MVPWKTNLLFHHSKKITIAQVYFLLYIEIILLIITMMIMMLMLMIMMKMMMIMMKMVMIRLSGSANSAS